MPRSLLEQLPDIVEHPAFQSFYDDLKSEGLLGESGDDYWPDFLVRTEDAVYLVETKAQDQTRECAETLGHVHFKLIWRRFSSITPEPISRKMQCYELFR